MSLGTFFHVGIVVPDLDAARTHFSELLGVEWGPVMETELRGRDGDGREFTTANRICYSTSPPYLELIHEAPGTPWVCNEHSNLHHLGYFSERLVADSGHLRATACPLEIMDGHGDGPPAAFTYHRDPLGVRIELVNAELRSSMERYLMRLPAGPAPDAG